MRHWDYGRDASVAQPVAERPFTGRQHRGRQSHLSGAAAEDAVQRLYLARGATALEHRWRGPAGEIDLIFREGDTIVFVEVKASRDFASAAERISARQANRIARSAVVYLGDLPDGLLTDMRIDVALVDGIGAVEVLENAFAGMW